MPAEQRAPPESRCLVGGAFRAVPPELLRRVLGLLSAHDLSAAVSVTCRGLRAAAADNILWRRLYKARCGRLGSASALHGSLLQWGAAPGPWLPARDS